MTNPTLINNLRVASPCPTSWDSMSGDERVRFCQLCQLNVYNLSEMTAVEVEKLVLTTEGRICGRLYQRADGMMITRDCPEGLAAIRKRVARRVSAVLTAILSLTSLTFSQSTNKTSDNSTQTVSELKIDRSVPKEDQKPGVEITIVDTNGAVIVGAEVSLKNLESRNVCTSITNDSGSKFPELAPGRYDLEVKAPGFKTKGIRSLEIKEDEIMNIRIKLDVLLLTGLILIQPQPTSFETPKVSMGTTILRGEALRRLPNRD